MDFVYEWMIRMARYLPYHERRQPEYVVIRVADPDPDTVFLHGSGSGFKISLDPDPAFKFLWIRIRIRFQPRFWNKKKLQKGL